MKIKCIANSGSALPSDCRNELVNITEETQFHLTIGKTYNVYGMTIFLGYIWYYILMMHISIIQLGVPPLFLKWLMEEYQNIGIIAANPALIEMIQE